MTKNKIISLLFICFMFFPSLFANKGSGIIINEVMPDNTNSIIDLKGQRSGWIELYNDSEASVNIGGCYITNNPGNNTVYQIRKKDRDAVLAPKQRVVIYCNEDEHTSIFHTNFKLNKSAGNYIALVSANGLDIIDEVNVPVLEENQSWGAQIDGDKDSRAVLEFATPAGPNNFEVESSSVEKFRLNDPFGIGMALTAMGVVFCALLTLFISFKIIGKISVRLTNARARRAAGLPHGAEIKNDTSGEVYAAIAMALQLHEDDDHDYEDTVLTLKTVEKRYSPWSSKLYGLRENPRR